MATLNEDSHRYLLDCDGPPDADIAALEKILSRKRYRRRRGAPGWAVMGALAASLLLGTAIALFANFETTPYGPVEDAAVEVAPPVTAPHLDLASEDSAPTNPGPEGGAVQGGTEVGALPLDTVPVGIPGPPAVGEAVASELTAPMQ